MGADLCFVLTWPLTWSSAHTRLAAPGNTVGLWPAPSLEALLWQRGRPCRAGSRLPGTACSDAVPATAGGNVLLQVHRLAVKCLEPLHQQMHQAVVQWM